MEDKANGNGHGGRREGAGRKTRAEEDDLIAKLKPMDTAALQMIQEGLESKDSAILKIFMAYRYGQPRQTIDANISGELFIDWSEVKKYETK